jgi:CheY-like chemotaxis protein
MKNTNPATILLVEDNKADIELLKQSLDILKYNIRLFAFTDGFQVMDFIQNKGIHQGSKKPDLIILDINLPGKNGFEILKEFRNDNSFNYTPIVILSTSQNEEDILLSRKLKADAFFSKPSDFFEFNSLVKSIIDSWLKNKISV